MTQEKKIIKSNGGSLTEDRSVEITNLTDVKCRVPYLKRFLWNPFPFVKHLPKDGKKHGRDTLQCMAHRKMDVSGTTED